jgi:hypothetical protein
MQKGIKVLPVHPYISPTASDYFIETRMRKTRMRKQMASAN